VAKPAETTCKVKQGSNLAYSGPCTFKFDGDKGSFSISPIGAADIEGANPITVSVVEAGIADVRGLTKDGINSRWGEAKRSKTDKACWTGSDFEICAYAGNAPSTGKATVTTAVKQTQGQEYWAVYVVEGAKQDEPAVKASIDALTKRGLEFGSTMAFGSLGCDLGSAAALKAPDSTNALGVYFANKADADAFAATLTPTALATVKIKAMCRD
jgi:hypothetical protein